MEKKVIDLNPGQYRIRYYLKRHPIDPDVGKPETVLLGEGQWTVLGDPSVGRIPLQDPRHTFRVDSE